MDEEVEGAEAATEEGAVGGVDAAGIEVFYVFNMLKVVCEFRDGHSVLRTVIECGKDSRVLYLFYLFWTS